ncbi:MAG: hypothetical protein KIT25_14420 [Enhydrobacter sp.]|nr:MAG: hypothetical protein KIT25_14420 [Enhydrobacter sp.]
MTIAALPRTASAPTLDYSLLCRGFGGFAAVAVLLAPFSNEPFAIAVGGIVPWLLLRIVATDTMPAAVAYYFIWQWVQVFARALQAWIDGQPMILSLEGPAVPRAYWYMLASLVVMACVVRLMLGSVRRPTQWERTAHYYWQPVDLIILYGVGSAVAIVMGIGARSVGSLAQPLMAISQVKVVAIFMLFVYVMSTGRGTKFLFGVVLFEIVIGITGFFSNFRGVFIYLGIAAIAARVKWRATTTIAAVTGLTALVGLALFWTAVKVDYRIYVAQSDDAQAINVPLSERLAYIGSRFFSLEGLNLQQTSYTLLSRLAYTDIFGAVIGVQEAHPEPIPARQWREAIGHLTMPRFLFPGKAPLSDSEVYMRLARTISLGEEIRAGTSISVGYMGENFADFGFPGMLFGVAMVAFIVGGVARILMGFQLPQAMREGVLMAFFHNVCHDGVEVSLAKTLGATVMFLIGFLLLNKFVFPRVLQWLELRSRAARYKLA